MARTARLGLLFLLQLWLTPLLSVSAATSLRGPSSSSPSDASIDANASASDESEIVSSASSIQADEENSNIVEHISEDTFPVKSHRRASNHVERLAVTSNNTATGTAIDQNHRDDRWSEMYGLDPSPEQATPGPGRLFPYHSRIIGGKDVESTYERYSYTVSLQDEHGYSFCGGSLISKDTVLTAGHCASVVTGNEKVYAVIGRRTLSQKWEGERIKVVTQKTHPKFDVDMANVEWNYDFALLFLSRKTRTNAKVIKVNDDSSLPRGGSIVTVLGWGDTDPDENVRSPSDTLQAANLRVVPNDLCNSSSGMYHKSSVSYSGYIHDDMMCARNRKRDSCQGDSGGPLTHRGKLVGITSWGVGCRHKSFPGVYARVSAAHDWIRKYVCARSLDPDPSLDCEPW